MSEIDRYQQFVESLLSVDSKDIESYQKRILYVQEEYGFNLVRLDTAATGMSAESGEFMEIIKKIKFQGKPLTEESVYHLKRELGDIMFYAFCAMQALDTNMEEIINMNVDKLKSRYPGGEFVVFNSENRQAGDL